MKFVVTKQRKALIILISICIFSTYNVANASFISNVSSGAIDILKLVNSIPFISSTRKDFCDHYFVAIKNNEWKEGEFRVKVGKGLCSMYKDSSTVEPIPLASSTPSIEIKKTNKVLPDITKNNIAPLVESGNLPGALIDLSGTDGNGLNNNQIIYWTGIERSKNDLSLVSLAENKILDRIALERVNDMFAKEYFEHVSPTGDNVSKMSVRDGYSYITIGENIALGNFGGSRELLVAWMNSPGHRANILNKNYTQIGVAAIEGMYKGQKVWIAAQIFGKPLSDCKKPDESIKTSIAEYTKTANILNQNLTKIKEELSLVSATEYNQKVSEYNSVAQTFNNLLAKIKNITIEYNKGVQDFNNCIKTK